MRVRPEWLLYAALVLTLGAAFAFTRGWLWAAACPARPFDAAGPGGAAARDAPAEADLSRNRYLAVLLWPAAGLALIALGWWEARHGGGWGAVACAVMRSAFAQAYRSNERIARSRYFPLLFSRRNAILGAALFAPCAAPGRAILIAVLIYAAISFFFVQYLVHRLRSELTTH